MEGHETHMKYAGLNFEVQNEIGFLEVKLTLCVKIMQMYFILSIINISDAYCKYFRLKIIFAI